MTTPIFFRPDDKFVDWIGETANDRIIFDIGFGSGHLLKRLHERGFSKLMGIEPYSDVMEFREDWHRTNGMSVPHTFQEPIGEGIHMSMLALGGDKLVALLVRPCHHPFLVKTSYEVCKANGIDLYYIGLEKNLNIDLGFMDELNIVEHEGSSHENELVIKLV